MNQTVTQAIILSRTNYGEADRILTVLTPRGKYSLLAKGVRKERSKLAGGIELLSVSELSFLRGRGEMQTLTSSRLKTHFGNIVQNVDRTMFAYEFLKTINQITEQSLTEDYFQLAKQTLRALNSDTVALDIVRLWFFVQLLRLEGHAPNLKTNATGVLLIEAPRYVFDFDRMAFSVGKGLFTMRHIKLLRLLDSLPDSSKLSQLQPDALEAVPEAERLIRSILRHQQ